MPRRLLAVLAILAVACGVGAQAQRRGLPPAGRGMAPPRDGGPGRSATAGRIETRTYVLADTNEVMEYAVFVSTKVDTAKPCPLVIGLHGLGTPPAAWLSRITDAAEKAGYIVAAPTGYSLTGWYGANAGGRPVGITNVGALSEKDVMNVLDLMRKEFNIDERRIYLAGHSMGGAGALFLGIKHKEIWAAVSASAPAIRTNLHTPVELEQATEMPFILIHGDADTAVPVEQTRGWAAKMRALKMTYEYREIRGGTHASTLPLGAPFTFKFFDRYPKVKSRDRVDQRLQPFDLRGAAFNFSYSRLACCRMGMSASASFQSAKKS
jgi:poly(3-hydroxybutyrate) depolymerase